MREILDLRSMVIFEINKVRNSKNNFNKNYIKNIVEESESDYNLIKDFVNAEDDEKVFDLYIMECDLKRVSLVLKYYYTNIGLYRNGLINALEYGYDELCKPLIEYGIDLESENDMGQTSLILSITNNMFDIVQMLVKAGVNVNKPDIFKQSPLMYSICEFRHDIMRLLLKNGADKYFQTELGNTPLMIAVNVNNIEAVKILIEYGVDDLIENTYSNNARDCAVIDSDIYNLLINTFGAQNRESTDEDEEDVILFEPFFF